MFGSSSKAFRATLSAGLLQYQIENISRWAEANLACSAVFRDDAHRPILLGLQSRSRTAASFSRMLRTALQRMAINVPRGHFVKLASTHEVLAMARRAGHSDANANATPRSDDEDVRVIHVRT
jgi:hypothetical protein